jgi:hypothetical protein
MMMNNLVIPFDSRGRKHQQCQLTSILSRSACARIDFPNLAQTRKTHIKTVTKHKSIMLCVLQTVYIYIFFLLVVNPNGVPLVLAYRHHIYVKSQTRIRPSSVSRAPEKRIRFWVKRFPPKTRNLHSPLLGHLSLTTLEADPLLGR